MSKENEHIGAAEAVVEKVKPQLKPPPKYQVVMLNDDYTPMDFVIVVLESFFNLSAEQAVRVMLDVHNKGKANCGVFTRDVAETKVAQVVHFARHNEHPLQCTIERV